MRSLVLAWAVILFGVAAASQTVSPSPGASPVTVASPQPTPTPVSLQVPPSNPDSVVSNAVADVKGGKYTAAVSGLVLLLVWVFRTLVLPTLGLGSGVLPLVSLGLGAIAGLATHALGIANASDSAQIALVSGPAAMTVWSSFLKLFQKKPTSD